MKAILKSDRRVVLEVELLCQWVYITERRTESTYSDKEEDESMDITVSEFAIDIANTLVKKLKSESNG